MSEITVAPRIPGLFVGEDTGWKIKADDVTRFHGIFELTVASAYRDEHARSRLRRLAGDADYPLTLTYQPVGLEILVPTIGLGSCDAAKSAGPM